MKLLRTLAGVLVCFLILLAAQSRYATLHPEVPEKPVASVHKKMRPALAEAWKWSYPEDVWNADEASRKWKNIERWLHDEEVLSTARLIDGAWRTEGPNNIGGRFNFIQQHPSEPFQFFAGSSSGGLWMTPGDDEWVCITEDLPAMSTGDLVFHPDYPERMFLATGDPQISSFPRIGAGVFRSMNGGANWQSAGLDSMGVISKLLYLDGEQQALLAGAMGNPAIPGPNRGLFKSLNYGLDWEQVLLPNDSAGITDIIQDPASGDLFASAWHRTRTSTESIVSGPHCRIWKSTDQGENWFALENPWGPDERGRIGLAVSNSGVHALVVGQNSQLDNIYRTQDGGTSWEALIPIENIPENALGGFGWYFSKIRINPFNDQDITILGVNLWNSMDGGANWSLMGPEWWSYEVHADKHDLQWIGPESCVLATDGGLYRTDDHGLSWEDIEDIPVSQFYRVTWNPHNPGVYTGGAQDNGTTTGSYLAPNEWTRDLGGDGFACIYHPENPFLRYAGYQWGNWRFSMTGPDEEPIWNDFLNGIDEEDRVWWDAPLAYHPANPDVMLTGTQRVYRMNNAPENFWQAVSPDLTENSEPGLSYRCISTVAGSQFDENKMAAGTTDGHLWITEDGGGNWTPMETGLPGQFVTDVEFDPHFPDSMFCTVSGYRNADYEPYIFRAAIGGPWQSIQGNLPVHPVNQILPLTDSIWAVATDAGVFATNNWGNAWQPVGELPVIPVYDLAADTITDRLVAGTFARSILSFPLDSIVPESLNPVDTTGQNTVQRIPNALKAFPNPFTDELNLDSEMPWRECRVIGSDGKTIEVLKRNGQTERVTFDATNWPIGINFLHLQYTSGQEETLRLLKQ